MTFIDKFMAIEDPSISYVKNTAIPDPITLWLNYENFNQNILVVYIFNVIYIYYISLFSS